MGMFDSLWVDCPKCNEQIEFQSKAGPCVLADYNLNNVPLTVITAVEEDSKRGELYCEHCGVRLALKLQKIIHAEVVVARDVDYEDELNDRDDDWHNCWERDNFGDN